MCGWRSNAKVTPVVAPPTAIPAAKRRAGSPSFRVIVCMRNSFRSVRPATACRRYQDNAFGYTRAIESALNLDRNAHLARRFRNEQCGLGRGLHFLDGDAGR